MKNRRVHGAPASAGRSRQGRPAEAGAPLSRSVAAAISAFCLLLFPIAASACPVCFGDPSSKMTIGAQNGILFLLVVIGLVQIGFVAMFWAFWRRAKVLRARREQFHVIDGGMTR